METRTERRTLKHVFTEEELLALGEDLSVKNQDLMSTENEKKSVVSQYGSRINELKEGIGALSNKVANKFEHREVDCEVEYHTPDKGIKTLTRGDTGQTFTEKMSSLDYDLFNQYQDEEEVENEMKVSIDGKPVNLKKMKDLAKGGGDDLVDLKGKPFEKDPLPGDIDQAEYESRMEEDLASF